MSQNFGNVSDKKETLQRSIEHMKNNIQYMIDNKKSVIDPSKVKELEEMKKNKLAELKKLTDELKECVKKEKEDKKKANELKVVTRTIDSLEFAGARKSKSQEGMEKAKRAKEARETAKKEYEMYLAQSEQYNKYDSQTVPGYLFLHEKIINVYGLCPFIRTVVDINEESTINVENNRKGWLKRQNDEGVLYYNLYNQLVNKEDVIKWNETSNKIENDIDYFIHSNLSETQFKMWENCKETASEYIGCTIKTKRIKEKFKMLVHTLSLLFAETNFSLHQYLTLKHTFTFVINELKRENDKSIKMDKNMQMILSSQFIELLDNYTVAKDKFEQATRYVTNVYRNLQNDMYLFMMNKKSYDTIISPNSHRGNRPTVAQQGKYFKRWTALSEEEKLERFESWARFYIQKNMVQEKLLDDQDAADKAANLFNVIKTALLDKRLIYRDFKWNSKAGMIEKVLFIKYDQDKGEFYFNKKVTVATKNIDKTKLSKRKASVRTIVTKENERVINEEVLCYIVAKVQTYSNNIGNSKNIPIKKEDLGKPTIEKTDKEECIERIKTKLHLKKVTANDKVVLGKKYEEIFNVVVANKMEEK